MLVAFGALMTGAPAASASATGTNAAKQQVLSLLNDVRDGHGLHPLALRGSFTRVARTHAYDMVRRDYFHHDTLGGANWDARVRTAGLMRTVGENIGWGTLGTGTPQTIVRAWMNSPDHRRNILDPGFRLVGIGIAAGSFQGKGDARVYVTDFGG